MLACLSECSDCLPAYLPACLLAGCLPVFLYLRLLSYYQASYTVKNFVDFPIPSRDFIHQIHPGGE
jgi:hypothetical protein